MFLLYNGKGTSMDDLSKLESLCNIYSLGEIITSPEVVEGGLLHKMYKVVTTKGSYAIKKLNPTILKRYGVIDHLINSEKASRCFAQSVPVIAAKEFENKTLLHMSDDYYMVFDWIEGKSIFIPNITVEHCIKIGEVLGKIHQLDICLEEIEKNTAEKEFYQWKYYLEKCTGCKSKWYALFRKEFHNIVAWNESVIEASSILTERLVISHRDLDPKNVLWNDGTPYIIDWEAAGYVNPYQELIEIINYWTDDGNGNIDIDKFDALLNEYKKYVNLENVEWDMILAGGYDGMLGWLNYNLKRVLRIEGTSEDEVKIGEEQVEATIVELKKYKDKVSVLKQWLSRAVGRI